EVLDGRGFPRDAAPVAVQGPGYAPAAMSRRRTSPLKPLLNQIRAWAQQGRTDAWIGHQLGVNAASITEFRTEQGILRGTPDAGGAAARAPARRARPGRGRRPPAGAARPARRAPGPRAPPRPPAGGPPPAPAGEQPPPRRGPRAAAAGERRGAAPAAEPAPA